MSWDFETDPDFQRELDWVNEFVATQVEPLEFVLGDPYDKSDRVAEATVQPLREQVKQRGLWACHLGPELGGAGFGQLKLALLNECLGRALWAPSVFGCQAPDSGNAEILARFGSPEQKARFLRPLLDGEITSCYSMTEVHAGADPTLFVTSAKRSVDGWVIDGEKWFSTNARYAAFFIVMAVSNPEVSPYAGMSMFIVPAETPGVSIVRNSGVGTEPEDEGSHGYVRFDHVRVPDECLLGDEGAAFAIAQTRLGGGRIHHAMRTVGLVRSAFDMMCERAVSRHIRGGRLGDLQMTQERVADSWIQMEQFRLLVLRTAWLIDKYNDYRKVRKDIAAVKVAMPVVLHDVVQRAMHLHGALGISNEMPFSTMMVSAEIMALADGPTEVHKVTVARQILREYEPIDGAWPSAHLPTRREAALAAFSRTLDHAAAEH